MDLKQIEKLMAAMGRTGIKKLSVKEEGFELHLERGDEGIDMDRSLLSTAYPEENYTQQHPSRPGASLAANHLNKTLETASSEDSRDTISSYVTSPMVGTFYSSSSPNDPPYVKIGDKIDENSVVCIIEAMKVMNEVKSGVQGTVVEVLAKNGEPLEFGTKIFRVLPN